MFTNVTLGAYYLIIKYINVCCIYKLYGKSVIWGNEMVTSKKNHLEYKYEIRDAVFGDLKFTKEENKVIDSPEMQRLRGIRQLGFVYLVYPDARHSRFEHSLACCDLIRRVKNESLMEIEKDDLRILRLGALLHDIGMPVFSHALEFGLPELPHHEEITINILKGNVQAEDGKKGLCSVLDSKTRTNVIKCLKGEDEYRCYKGLLNGGLDIDMLEYLKRDPYFCGVPYHYDDRILSKFKKTEHGICFDNSRDTINAILNILMSRYHMMEAVYNHHTVLIAEQMIIRAIEEAIGRDIEYRDLFNKTNDEILLKLKDSQDKQVRDLINKVRERRLFKRAYEISYYDRTRSILDTIENIKNSIIARGRLIREVVESVKEDDKSVEKEDILLYLPKREQIKELNEIFLYNENGKSERFDTVVPDSRFLNDRYNLLWRFYVYASSEEKRNSIGKACERIFGIRSASNQDKRVSVVSKDSIKNIIETLGFSHLRLLNVLVKEKKPLSRDELSKLLGLDKSTVSLYVTKVNKTFADNNIKIFKIEKRFRKKQWSVNNEYIKDLEKVLGEYI